MNLNIKTTMITFNDIVAFIKKAIDKKYAINSYSFGSSDTFNIENFNIEFLCESNLISIYDNNFSRKTINYNFTERDILDIKNLMLSVKEMNEEKLENKFYNFFNEDDNKPVDINDLDDEEDK